MAKTANGTSTTNYYDTLILVSPDSAQLEAKPSFKDGSVAALQFARAMAQPYSLTSDDVIFSVFAARNGVEQSDETRAVFFSKGQACFRASPLVKTHGYGVHHDAAGNIAVYGVETAQYRDLLDNDAVTKIAGMRSKRK